MNNKNKIIEENIEIGELFVLFEISPNIFLINYDLKSLSIINSITGKIIENLNEKDKIIILKNIEK